MPTKRRKRFEPSFRTLLRILETLLEVDSISKTDLSQKAGINYSRLLLHLDWLGERKTVVLIVEKHKVIVRLTSKGKELASIFLKDDKTA